MGMSKSDSGHVQSFGTVEEARRGLSSGDLRHTAPNIADLSEGELARYFSRLAERNYHIDKGIYPLGSCTMKYNPKVNDSAAALAGFEDIHPQQEVGGVQGALQLIHTLSGWLAEITGLPAVSLQPAAGAHGELVGMLIARAHFRELGQDRSTVLIPDSAHGSNPASAAAAGFKSVVVASGEDGLIDIGDLELKLTDDVAAVMMTNPNTHGLFEAQVQTVCSMAHERGTLMYLDGANLNALLGVTDAAIQGFDICHVNLHKTFSTPHGGGGPGAAGLCVTSQLEKFLPYPVIKVTKGRYSIAEGGDHSIGRSRSYFGNFANLVRAYTYIVSLGSAGLIDVGRTAVLNANYLMAQTHPRLTAPFGSRCMHEFIVSAESLEREQGIRALDISKALLDRGVHAPTMYFPLTVPQALLVEPTETESKGSLDGFATNLSEAVEWLIANPEKVDELPATTPVARLDEATAARRPRLRG